MTNARRQFRYRYEKLESVRARKNFTVELLILDGGTMEYIKKREAFEHNDYMVGKHSTHTAHAIASQLNKQHTILHSRVVMDLPLNQQH